MSKEFSFHNRKFNVQPKQQMIVDKKDAKPIILKEFEKFQNLKLNDEKIKYLYETQEKISNEIVLTLSLFQKSTTKEQNLTYSQKLENLTELHKKLKNEYQEILKVELKILSDNWPQLFDKIVNNNLDRQTLEHVLSVFDEYQKGNLSNTDAIRQGMTYEKLKYNLPENFYDTSDDAIKKYTDNLKTNLGDTK